MDYSQIYKIVPNWTKLKPILPKLDLPSRIGTKRKEIKKNWTKMNKTDLYIVIENGPKTDKKWPNVIQNFLG